MYFVSVSGLYGDDCVYEHKPLTFMSINLKTSRKLQSTYSPSYSRFQFCNVNTCTFIKNEVDVQNNILHTLGEANRGGEEAIFHFSFPATPQPFGPLKFKKCVWCPN